MQLIIFETDRLIVRRLCENDFDDYYDMMGNPNVMNLVPRKVKSRKESDEHLEKFIHTDQNLSETKVWGIELKNNSEFIGLCAFLKNQEKDNEIGYRLREKFWRMGLGTEITKGLISFGFEKLNMNKITADVDTNNQYSVKILRKFMTLEKEFYNTSDKCIDQRYYVLKDRWSQQSI
jgi:RimJ/RimL family protein N-acetyltransferase